MENKRKQGFLLLLRKIRTRTRSHDDDDDDGDNEKISSSSSSSSSSPSSSLSWWWSSWKRFSMRVATLKWKKKTKRLNFKISVLEDILFKIVSAFEALILVSAFCFFYCFCGCHV